LEMISANMFSATVAQRVVAGKQPIAVIPRDGAWLPGAGKSTAA
jgi:hypothetical protein